MTARVAVSSHDCVSCGYVVHMKAEVCEYQHSTEITHTHATFICNGSALLCVTDSSLSVSQETGTSPLATT